MLDDHVVVTLAEHQYSGQVGTLAPSPTNLYPWQVKFSGGDSTLIQERDIRYADSPST